MQLADTNMESPSYGSKCGKWNLLSTRTTQISAMCIWSCSYQTMQGDGKKSASEGRQIQK